MPLSTGSRLGPYEISAAIGAGGMGEVYRARDSKLGRDVAIKVLPETFARDQDRLARFEREAKVLASLDHPNIASIYGLEDSGGTHALVMQLVEGPTLAERIRQGPIPIDESVRIAKQICEALEYAHERGIVHRDLKPANVKVTADDAVKVLDFGLAKAIEGDPASIDIATSPTISRMATLAGVLLGTAAYMSPEQAKGKPVDRRADIWAFGCVLYEMLTAKMAFRGESVTDTLAAVIKEEPNWSQLPASTPMRVRVLLQRCLQKDSKQRLRDIGDARVSLDEVLSGSPDPALAGTPQAVAPLWRRALPWAVAGAFAIAFAALALVHFQKKPVLVAPVERFEIPAPDPIANEATLSPDGTSIVFSSDPTPSRLWLRRIDSLETHPIEGTEGALGIPFWSPDSRSIAFGTSDQKLKKVDTQIGSVEIICDTGPLVVGGFWTRDGRIIFSDFNRPLALWQVSAAGGVSSPLPGYEHAGNPYVLLPVLLPDEKHFLYTTGGTAGADVYVGSLDGMGQQSSKKLLTGDGATYARSENDPDFVYLLFGVPDPGSATRTVMAQLFDLRKLELDGEPTPIIQRASALGASLMGTIVYRSTSSALTASQLTLFDRQGKVLGTAGQPGTYWSMAFSPDEKRVVASRENPQSRTNSLWVTDLGRGVSTRLTFGPADDIDPVWSPDGSRIVFTSNRGNWKLYEKPANGGGDDELLYKSDEASASLSWSRDGRFLLFGSGEMQQGNNRVLPLDKNGRVAGQPFLFTGKGVGLDLKFSPGPQGRPLWVASSSNESGRSEIYVRPFDPDSPTGSPPNAGKWQVSTEGGMSPRWNGNGKELFYVTPDGTVMSVEVSGSNGVFQAGIPKPLFRPKGLDQSEESPVYFNWDAGQDGQKFIFATSPSGSGTAPPPKFTVVLNWPSLLKK